MKHNNVSSIEWSINVLKVALDYNYERLVNTLWNINNGTIIIYYLHTTITYYRIL